MQHATNINVYIWYTRIEGPMCRIWKCQTAHFLTEIHRHHSSTTPTVFAFWPMIFPSAPSMGVCCLTGGPVDTRPTLFLAVLALIWGTMMSAPGKSFVWRRRFPEHGKTTNELIRQVPVSGPCVCPDMGRVFRAFLLKSAPSCSQKWCYESSNTKTKPMARWHGELTLTKLKLL